MYSVRPTIAERRSVDKCILKTVEINTYFMKSIASSARKCRKKGSSEAWPSILCLVFVKFQPCVCVFQTSDLAAD